MTLPTNSTSTVAEDDSDMFGPPHSSPPIRRNRPKVPMISPQLKQREVRKRILQLCVHKLERIKDSERNLRRSVCINNTYSRLTDDIRREKQHKLLMLSNLAKSTDSSRKQLDEDDVSSEDCINNNNNITNANNNNNNISSSNNNTNGSHLHHHHHHHHHHHRHHHDELGEFVHNNENMNNNCQLQHNHNLASQHHHNHLSHHQHLQALHQRLAQSPIMSNGSTTTTTTAAAPESNGGSDSAADRPPSSPVSQRKPAAASSVEADLETLDRELCALDAAMPLVDPEITQGAEQLEQAMVSRKRKFASIDDDDSDRLVREALSQIYFPSAGRLLTGIDDCPPATEERREEDEQQQQRTSAGDAAAVAVAAAADCISPKRPKIGDLLEQHQSQQQQQQLHSFSHPFLHPFHPLPDLVGFDYQVHHHHQKEFEVIMDALRLGVSNGGAMAAAAVVAATSAAATGNATGTAMMGCCGVVAGSAAGSGSGPSASVGPASCQGTVVGGGGVGVGAGGAVDSCGQAAMLMGGPDGGASVFHNLVVTSLET